MDQFMSEDEKQRALSSPKLPIIKTCNKKTRKSFANSAINKLLKWINRI
jgi:hypothetical protein